MKPETWLAVDEWFAGRLLVGEEGQGGMEEVRRRSSEAGLPEIAVSAMQGKFLYMLAKIAGARRVLEIGTLGGYSTIWLARAVGESGRVVTLELSAKHAEVARGNFAAMGVSERVEVRVGRAAESLERMGGEVFDLVFIDADKESTLVYLEKVMGMVRSGSVIVIDNVVRGGKVADPSANGADVAGLRAAHEWIAKEPRLEGAALQMVGAKGWDGMTVLRVR